MLFLSSPFFFFAFPFQTEGMPEELQPRFVHNASGRFESRWSTVKVRRRRVARFGAGVVRVVFFFSFPRRLALLFYTGLLYSYLLS